MNINFEDIHESDFIIYNPRQENILPASAQARGVFARVVHKMNSPQILLTSILDGNLAEVTKISLNWNEKKNRRLRAYKI